MKKIITIALLFVAAAIMTITAFAEEPASGLRIVITDSIGGEPLVGARFRVIDKNGDFVGDISSGKDGTAVIPAIEPGWYIISEYLAPSGYSVDETPRTVEIDAQTEYCLEFRNTRLSSLKIINTDENGGVVLKGSRFLVTTQNGDFVGDICANKDGAATIPAITPGKYIVTQTKAAPGYIISKASWTVDVKIAAPTVIAIANRAENATSADYTDSEWEITVTGLTVDTLVISKPKPPEYVPTSAIEITEVDEATNEPIAGAVFDVFSETDEKVGSYTTNADGKALVTGISDGTYTIYETAAPDGYYPNDTAKTVTVSGGVVSAEFFGKPLSGLLIRKIDSDTGQPVAGALFSISGSDGEFIGVYATDSDGVILIPELTQGDYIVKEVKTADSG